MVGEYLMPKSFQGVLFADTNPASNKKNVTPDGRLACAFGRPWWPPHDCYKNGCCDENRNALPVKSNGDEI